MSNAVRAFLLLSFVSIVEPFPVALSPKSSATPEHARLFISRDDSIDAENVQNIDTQAEIGSNSSGSEDTKALSGLLDEMFQAKQEMSREKKELELLSSQDADMPVLGNDGVYRIISQSQLENFKDANSDKLVFLKFSSPICAACRMLKQKFQTLHRSPKFAGVPVVFADIMISNNKKVKDPFRDYVTSQLRVQRVPSIHFYARGNDSDANHIYCDDGGGACSWPKIQRQMLAFVGEHTAPEKVKTTHEMSSSNAAVAEATSPESTTTTTVISTTKATKKISKRKRIRGLIVSWLT